MTIPRNWAECNLGQIIELSYGKSLPKKQRRQGSYEVFGSNGPVGKHIERLVKEPCLIVGRKGAAGAVHLAVHGGWPIDTTYYVIPPCNIPIRFLYYLLTNLKLVELDKSTAIPGLNRDDAYAKKIILPPLHEQHRIVAKIEELFSDLDAGIASLKKAKEQLKTYRQAVLKWAFEFASMGMEQLVALEALIDSIGQGWSPKCLRESAPNDIWSVMKTTAVQTMMFLPEENKRLPENLSPRPGIIVEKGDVLITRAGPRNRVGVCCVAKKSYSRLMVCDKVYRLKLKKKKIEPAYFELLLNSPSITNKLNALKTGISDSGVNLTQGRFLQLEIPVPALPVQEQIVMEVDSRLSVADNLDKSIEESIAKSEFLRQSILKQAFTGKLVPQDPNDEPAEKLLERIRAIKNNVAAKSPTRRKGKASK